MRGVLLEVPAELLAERVRIGADKSDVRFSTGDGPRLRIEGPGGASEI